MPSKSMVKSSDRNSERVMVFVDGSNLYHVLGQNCSRHNVHFDKLANKLSNGRDLKRTYYYNIRQEDQNGEQQKFLDSMFDTPYLEVKLGISKQRGETVVDWLDVTERNKNCLVINEVNSEGFFKLLRKKLSLLP